MSGGGVDVELLAVALAIGLPALAVAIGQGWVASSAIDVTWRQPEAVNEARGIMILGLAFLEALAIYGLLIAFLLLGRV
ncbi:MAG: ATP synthase F0 subunit C [Clostridia bacterium]|nr:ATP synthase F0 subunit C [Clostridia bacterium]